MGMIPEPDQLIEIVLYYKEIKINTFNKVVVLEDEKAKEMLENEETKDKVKKLTTHWREMSWQDSNNITKAARVEGPNAKPGELDYYRYRDLRLKICMKKWDLKDDDGNDVILSPEIINQLPVDIVIALVSKYDEVVEMSEEEVGN